MVISKTPFRISLFGGSTDYESFYSRHGSLLVGFAINKYCFITARKNPNIFDFKTKVSYSILETVNNNKDIRHNGVRGVVDYFNLHDERLEISYFSDLPAQTGIGSSSSFVVGLINAIKHDEKYSPKTLANYAIEIERQLLKEIGGIQDQIWAAYGGLNSISINNDGSFHVRPIPVSEEFITEFVDSSFLIYTGKQRKSFEIASSHNTGSDDTHKQNILKLAHQGYQAFCSENKSDIGLILKDSWESKKKISKLICNEEIDDMMTRLSQNGMIGGKLIGSGGSGFIFGITNDKSSKERIKDLFRNNYVEYNISPTGSKIINE